MRTSVSVSVYLILFVSAAAAQSDPFPRYGIAGLVVVPDSQNRTQMEVRLVSEIEIPMGRVLLYPQERFAFSNLPAGRYYLLMSVPGYKAVRQRVDVSDMEAGTSASIFLEPQGEWSAPKPLYLTGDANLVDVKEMRQGKALKYLAEAEKKLRKGAISDARHRLESIVRETPDSYDAHRLLASAYRQSLRYEDAAKGYLAAHALRPRSVAPLVDLGSLYLEQIDSGSEIPEKTRFLVEEARKVLLQAVQTNPDAAFAHYLLGVTYYRSASNGEAERSLRRALELEPRLGDARLALVNVYLRAGNWSAVLAELDSYLKENPRAAGREPLLQKRAQIERIARGQVAEAAGR
jgi:cytochrome c-type biogenesis protein CcmH/NrfG